MIGNQPLHDYCEFIKRFGSHKSIFILDCQLNVIYANQLAHELCERLSVKIKEYSNMFDIIRRFPHFDTKKELYENTIRKNSIQGYFITHQMNDDQGNIINRISIKPIIYEEKELIGIEVEIIAMETLPFINVLNDDYDYSDIGVFKLTQREREIIFLKAMGKTNSEISAIFNEIFQINVTEKTINNITLQQIYPKLGVLNKKELTKKICALGLDKFIPKSLITKDQLILFPTL